MTWLLFILTCCNVLYGKCSSDSNNKQVLNLCFCPPKWKGTHFTYTCTAFLFLKNKGLLFVQLEHLPYIFT